MFLSWYEKTADGKEHVLFVKRNVACDIGPKVLPHIHNSIEFAFGLKGKSEVFVNDKKYELKEGDIIGLNDKNIISKGDDIAVVTGEVIAKMVTPDIMNISLFYGNEVQEVEAQVLADKISKIYPNIEVDFHFGGQPLYYYIVSVE